MRSLTFRAADQLAWSFAFFLFNTVALSALPVDQFASLAVVTAIGFMAIAFARSYAINAGIVIATLRGVPSQRSVRPRHVLRVYVWTAIATGVVVYAWLGILNTADSLVLALFCAALVLVDAPRQVLITVAKYGPSLLLSVAYLLAACVIFSVAPRLGDGVVAAWGCTLIIITFAGWLSLRVGRAKATWYTGDARSLRTEWSLGLEAIYFGLAGQIGLLALFAISNDAAAVAIRVSYALVYAPAFSLIQGFSPLLSRRLSGAYVHGRGTSARRTILAWSVLVCGLALASAFASFIWLPWVSSDVSMAEVGPFLIPVGLTLASYHILEAVVAARRMSGSSNRTHLQRSILAGADIAGQVAGVILAGTTGLVLALLIMSLVRVTVCCVYFVKLPKDASG